MNKFDDLIRLAGGAASWPELFSSGRFELSGDPFLALRFAALFRLPVELEPMDLPEPLEPRWRGAVDSLVAVAALLGLVLLGPLLSGAFGPGASGYAAFLPPSPPASLAAALSTLFFFGIQSLVEELLFRWSRFISWIISKLYFRYSVIGAEKIPKDGPVILTR